MSGYTKVDNWLFDAVMPTVSPGAFKVISAVIRCTAGWNKESDTISLSQFQKMTGIANRTNLGRAIQEALDAGYIARNETGNSFEYRVRTSTETVPDEPKQYRNSTSTSTETVPVASTETVHTKDNIKDIEITTADPLPELAGHFTSVTGLFPKNGAYEDDWELPLTVILNGAGDLETAKNRINQAVELARGKGFRLASPRSITNIIANIPAGAAPNGAIKVRAI